MPEHTLYHVSRASFKRLVKGLMSLYPVYGTVEKDAHPAFGRLESFEDLRLFSLPTHVSAKGFFFPPREALLRFDVSREKFDPIIEASEQVVIGMHACDISAMLLMDRVYSHNVPDRNYLEKRKKTIIIGASCMPDEYCFCKSLGTDRVDKGFDLFVYPLRRGLAIEVGTDKGLSLLKEHAEATKLTSAHVGELNAHLKKRDSSFVTSLDATTAELPGIYERAIDAPVWEQIGAICTGCGSCNNVCPTCYCFDIRDEMDLNLTTGERVRYWDACTLEDFAKVAGGHNFRSKRSDRLRHRFNRKFRYLSDKFQSLFCVGCGRCSRACLVNINISSVTNEVIRWVRNGG